MTALVSSSWHPARQRVAAVAVLMAMSTGTAVAALGGSTSPVYDTSLYTLITVGGLFYPIAIAAQLIVGQMMVAGILVDPGGPPSLVLLPVVAAIVAIPAFVVIILAELFRWRSVFFYLIVSALIGLAIGLVQVDRMEPHRENAAALLAAVGAVGGFVYWLIAGRSAGFTGAAEREQNGDSR